MAIRNATKIETGVETSAPLKTLYHSHDTILEWLGGLRGLAPMVDEARRSRRLAAESLEHFNHDVIAHHADEERELFPAVVRSAKAGAERAWMQSLVKRLVEDHRQLEGLWARLEPSIRAAARGRGESVDRDLLDQLVTAYTTHAHFEEETFLPLAQAILSRDPNHLAGLGTALHMRRLPDITGHI